MARLPNPGSDNGVWGDILNDYLSQIHNTDGTLKNDVVTVASIAPNTIDDTVIADGSITETLLSSDVQTKLNAVAGTPDWDTITNKPAVIAAGATQADARTAIGAGTASTKSDVGLGNVDNTSDATKNSASATLTNKTLTDPKIATIKDANNNTALDLGAIAGAVNNVYIDNQPTGGGPTIGSTGSDTNIDLAITTKGTGVLYVIRGNGHSTVQAGGGYNGGDVNLELNSQGAGLVRANGDQVLTQNMTLNYGITLGGTKLDWVYDVNGYQLLTAVPATTPANFLRIGNAATGAAPFVQAEGTDTNVDLNLTTKGTGKVQANGNPVITSVTAISAVTGTPSSGNYLRGDGTWAAISAGDASTNTSSSVDSEIALFSGTGGKTLKRASGSGIASLSSGVLSTVTAPSGTIVGTSDSQTLTNKTLTNPTVNNYTEGVVAIGTVTTTCTLDLTNGTLQTATLTASTACTFTMPTAVAGKSFVLMLNQAAVTGNGTATFTSVKWNAAGAPTITATAGKMDILSFFSNGTSWYGSYTQGYTA